MIKPWNIHEHKYTRLTHTRNMVYVDTEKNIGAIKILGELSRYQIVVIEKYTHPIVKFFVHNIDHPMTSTYHKTLLNESLLGAGQLL